MFPQVQKVLGCRLVGDEYVIVFAKNGQDYALVLNPSGSHAFSLMDGRHSLEQIAETLVDGSCVQVAEVLPVLKKMVKRLERLGILTTRSTAWKTPCPVFLDTVRLTRGALPIPNVAEVQRLAVAAAPFNKPQGCALNPQCS
jgi:hypothetical protein